MCVSKHHNQRGFTLLEIMVALAILSVALIAILKSGGQNLSLLYEANNLTVVNFLAQQKLSEIESGLEGQATEGDFGEEFPNYRWKAEVLSPSIVFGGARLLQLTLTWKEGKHDKIFTLQRYISSQ